MKKPSSGKVAAWEEELNRKVHEFYTNKHKFEEYHANYEKNMRAWQSIDHAWEEAKKKGDQQYIRSHSSKYFSQKKQLEERKEALTKWDNKLYKEAKEIAALEKKMEKAGYKFS